MVWFGFAFHFYIEFLLSHQNFQFFDRHCAQLICCVYCVVLYCIVLYCIVLYCIVLYCIVLYCMCVCLLQFIRAHSCDASCCCVAFNGQAITSILQKRNSIKNKKHKHKHKRNHFKKHKHKFFQPNCNLKFQRNSHEMNGLISIITTTIIFIVQHVLC